MAPDLYSQMTAIQMQIPYPRYRYTNISFNGGWYSAGNEVPKTKKEIKKEALVNNQKTLMYNSWKTFNELKSTVRLYKSTSPIQHKPNRNFK